MFCLFTLLFFVYINIGIYIYSCFFFDVVFFCYYRLFPFFLLFVRTAVPVDEVVHQFDGATAPSSLCCSVRLISSVFQVWF